MDKSLKRIYRERLKILVFLGDVSLKDEFTADVFSALKEIKSTLKGTEAIFDLYEKRLISLNNLYKKLVFFMIDNAMMSFVPKYFNLSYHSLYETQPFQKLVIGDYSCEDQKLLYLFKSCLNESYQSKIKIIGNLKQGLSRDLLDESFSSFDNILLPKQIFSIVFLDIDDMKKIDYLQHIISNDYIGSNGKLILTISEDMIENVCREIAPYFLIKNAFKSSNGILVFLDKRRSNLENSELIDEHISFILEKVNESGFFDIPNEYHIVILPYINYDSKMENLKVSLNSDLFKSDMSDSVWSEFFNETSCNTNKKEKLVLPKTPKEGELNLIIASGEINGEMQLADGSGKHIVVGGVESVQTEQFLERVGKNGEVSVEQVITKMSEAFVNVLIPQNGVWSIKKLKGNLE